MDEERFVVHVGLRRVSLCYVFASAGLDRVELGHRVQPLHPVGGRVRDGALLCNLLTVLHSLVNLFILSSDVQRTGGHVAPTPFVPPRSCVLSVLLFLVLYLGMFSATCIFRGCVSSSTEDRGATRIHIRVFKRVRRQVLGLVVFNTHFYWLYFAAFPVVIAGLAIYLSAPEAKVIAVCIRSQCARHACQHRCCVLLPISTPRVDARHVNLHAINPR